MQGKHDKHDRHGASFPHPWPLLTGIAHRVRAAPHADAPRCHGVPVSASPSGPPGHRSKRTQPAPPCEIYFPCNVTLPPRGSPRAARRVRRAARKALRGKGFRSGMRAPRRLARAVAPCETALQVQARSAAAGRYIEAVSNAIPPGA
ncbi:hypothetical protein CBM2609_B10155 [Cupriavidus taiwanensis]|nr:hypothetical protein CBM2609_B10155 [Cupriavidus taiwanensis]SOZ47001.1 hypothetical protein CBM2610_B10154 [Cupriavidus taiwanensis]